MNISKSFTTDIKQTVLLTPLKESTFHWNKENKILISNILLSFGALFTTATIITGCTFLAVPITTTLIVKTTILGILAIAFITAGIFSRRNNDKKPSVIVQNGQFNKEIDRSLQMKITSVNTEPLVNHKTETTPIIPVPLPQAETPSPQTETPLPQVQRASPQAETPSPQVPQLLLQVQEPLPQAEMPSPQAETPLPQVPEPLPQAELPSTLVQEPLPQAQVQPTLLMSKPASGLIHIGNIQKLPFLSSKYNPTFGKENQQVSTKQNHLPNLPPSKIENQLALTRPALADPQIVLSRAPKKINIIQAFQATHKLNKKDLSRIQCFLKGRMSPLSLRIFSTNTMQNFKITIHGHPCKSPTKKNSVSQKPGDQEELALSDTHTKTIFNISLPELNALVPVPQETLDLAVATEEGQKKPGFWGDLTKQVGIYAKQVATKENILAAFTIGAVVVKAFIGTKNEDRPNQPTNLGKSDDKNNASLKNAGKDRHDQKSLLSQQPNLAECTPDGVHLLPLNYTTILPNSTQPQNPNTQNTEASCKNVILPGQPGYVNYQKGQQEQKGTDGIIKVYDPRSSTS
jgi:hypothetical protein